MIKKVIKIAASLFKTGIALLKRRLKDRSFFNRGVYAFFHKHGKIRDGVILYLSDFKNETTRNAFALFLDWTKDPQLARKKHVWSYFEEENVQELKSHFKNSKNISFIKIDSLTFYGQISDAKYIIGDQIPTYFSKKEGQVYVNTMCFDSKQKVGYDLSDNIECTSNEMVSLLMADYILSRDSQMTEIWMNSYKLRGAYSGKIIEEGSPFIDSICKEGNTVLIKKNFDFSKEYQKGINEDSNVSKRLKEIIFHKNHRGFQVLECDTKKKKLLIHHGHFKINGITSSLLNLINTIDYDKYDVTVTLTAKKAKEVENVKLLNKNARVMIRRGEHSATIIEEFRRNLLAFLGTKSQIGRWIYPKKLFQREFVRCFGSSQFDYIIDFNGYGWFFCYLYLEATHGKKMIWLHNDMLAERERIQNGSVILKNIASLYEKYDKVVSCSKSVMEVNRKNLAKESDMDRYTYAKNTINSEKVYKGLSEDQKISIDGCMYYLNDMLETADNAHNRKLIKSVDKECTNFVTIGRLSVEKNHKNLIEAFGKLYEKNPMIRLYILGDGPLYEELDNQIKRKKLEDKVILTGNMSNPFKLLSECDCFVLPSYHEGQPMVILEARCLKLPMILSDFSTVKECLIKNGQFMITTDKVKIYEGLKAFMEDKIKADYDFDPKVYNMEAYKEFENLLD